MEPSIIHDVLWQFNSSLSEHPVQQMVARKKAEEKGQKNSKVTITYNISGNITRKDNINVGHPK